MALIPPILWLETVDSTQLELKRILKENTGLQHLSSVSARAQSKGRGRGVSKWHDVPGNSVLLSVFLRWERPIAESFDVNRWVCARLRPLMPSPVSFKWPNDLMIGEQKLGGMLIENHWGTLGIKSSIVGIGLNIEKSPDALKRSISMNSLDGEEFTVAEWSEKILESFSHPQEEFLNIERLRSVYQDLLWGRDHFRTYHFNNTPVVAKVSGVAVDGRLILEQKNGVQISGDVDAIKWVNPFEED